MAWVCDSDGFLCSVAFSVIFTLLWCTQPCDGSAKFGFDIYHRFSDPVRQMLPVDGLPETGTLEYHAVMAHRDRIVHGRRLAGGTDRTHLAFVDGNETYRFDTLGYLHYASITVGTPALSFLVALDTGSDLFWLPCNCESCVHSLNSSTEVIELNIYSPNASSTSVKVPCSSTKCSEKRRCSLRQNACLYEVLYLSNNTSSSGILVEDVLHLVTNDNQSKVDAQITFGCGRAQTGSFLLGAAPNGLLGLGLESISVPSILATEGFTANSFSMCFGTDGIGRITFGDEGSSNKRETPIDFHESHPTYNVSATQIRVGENSTDISFSAVFDSGTSFTYLNDPAYTFISESFSSQVQDSRHQLESEIPFEYCYDLSLSETNFKTPGVFFTMQGGNQFFVTNPIVLFKNKQGGHIYCLGMFKSEDVNIIGQNFMTGYRMVFNRKKMVLSWEDSNCSDATNSTPLIQPPTPAAIPPAVAVDPGSTDGRVNGSNVSGASSHLGNHWQLMNALTCTLALVLLPFLPNI